MHTPDLPIHTPRLELRMLQPSDLDAYAGLNAIPEVVRYLYHEALSRDRSAERMDRAAATRTFLAEGDSLDLDVVVRETGVWVGYAVLVWTSAVHRSGEVGYVIHPRHAGRGYATEASAALLGGDARCSW